MFRGGLTLCVYFGLVRLGLLWKHIGKLGVLAVHPHYPELPTSFSVDSDVIIGKGHSGLTQIDDELLGWCNDRNDKFTPLKQIICSQNGHVALSGYVTALRHCENQFVNERWNCSLNKFPLQKSNNLKYDDDVITNQLKGTKEEAFYYAVTRAGIAHAITQTCSRLEKSGCGCNDVTKRSLGQEVKRIGLANVELRHHTTKIHHENSDFNSKYSFKNWKWGGCSDDLSHGVKLSRKLMGKVIVGNLTLAEKCNLHNSNVGRKVFTRLATLKCKCHGMSGSCATVTCWRKRPDMSRVATELKRIYQFRSKQVVSYGETLKYRKNGKKRLQKISKRDFVYLRPTPILCGTNPVNKVSGTRGRICGDEKDCRRLCCGNRYHTKIIRVVKKCKCKFQWCCEVNCQTCQAIEQVNVCDT